MTNKQVLEAQAEALKVAREKLQEFVGFNLNADGMAVITSSLIAICEQERKVAEFQLARDYVESQ